jgi:hypothetical protein
MIALMIYTVSREIAERPFLDVSGARKIPVGPIIVLMMTEKHQNHLLLPYRQRSLLDQ